MVDVIYDSNIFIMLSNNLISGDVEGFGIAILEANYFGLPAYRSKIVVLRMRFVTKKQEG